MWSVAEIYNGHATIGLWHEEGAQEAPLRFAVVKRSARERQSVGGVVDVPKPTPGARVAGKE